MLEGKTIQRLLEKAPLRCVLQSFGCVSQAVMLDDMIKAGTKPQAEHLLQFETRSLRDTRQLLSTVPIADTMQFIEQNPHPRYSIAAWLLSGIIAATAHSERICEPLLLPLSSADHTRLYSSIYILL